MRPGILALCALALAACASTPTDVPEGAPTIVTGQISGRLIDAQGLPLYGRVAIVSSAGSHSQGTQADGSFVFEDVMPYSYTLTGHTLDRPQIACADGVLVNSETELVLQSGATLWVELNGVPKARLAVSHGDTRVHNFTLREGRRVAVVVPAGDVRLRLYRGLDDERSLTLAAGESQDVRFDGR